MNKNSGFTVFEVLITSAIMVLVFIGIIAFYLMVQLTWIEGNAQINLNREARIAMEMMVRGVNGRFGLREGRAGTLVVTGGDNIEVSIDMNNPMTPSDSTDDTTISFYRNGDELFYDPDTSLTNNEYAIAENLRVSPSGLVFTVNGSSVTINLNMEDRVRSKTIGVDLLTEVRLRN